MKKYLKVITFYFLIWIGIAGSLNNVLGKNFTYSSLMMEDMYQSTTDIEVVFLGSSHTQHSYDANLADDMLGAETFNAGSSSQALITSYYLLKEIRKTNHIDTVYLDTYFAVGQLENLENELHIYDISDYMKWSWNKVEFLWNVGDGRGLFNGFLCSFKRNLKSGQWKEHIHTTKPMTESSTKFDNYEYRGKGFIYTYEAEKLKYPNIDFQKAAEQYDLTGEIPISIDSYEYLIKIIGYCAQNDIALVLVDQPMPYELLSRVKGYDHYVAFLSALAEENEIEYMNFNLYKGYEKNLEDYFDSHHLNGPGAQKYTRIFCNTINQLKNGEKTLEDFFYSEYVPVMEQRTTIE